MLARNPIANTLKILDSFREYSPVVLRNIRLSPQEIGDLEPLFNFIRNPNHFGQREASKFASNGDMGEVDVTPSPSPRARN